MYGALEVAKYVINYSIETGNEVSNLKLQKLLYYIQAAFLVDEDRKCFNDPIIAWEYGPVVESVYKHYKKYGRNDIDDRQEATKCLKLDEKSIRIVRYKAKELDKDDISIINNVVNAYSNVKNPFVLVKKTHEEDPWKNTAINKEITADSIRNYYNKERGKIYNQ